MIERAKAILVALGGADNVINVQPCITRMRVEVRDVQRVSVPALRRAGALAAIISGTGNIVQVVLGQETDAVVDNVERLGVARRVV